MNERVDRLRESLEEPLLVELDSPNEYTRQSATDNSGRWAGPRWEEAGHPENAGVASLDWSVSFDERQGDAEQLSQASVRHNNWVRDQRGGLSVPHVVVVQRPVPAEALSLSSTVGVPHTISTVSREK